MRLILIASGIIAGFLFGAWAFSRLFPTAPPWLGIAFSMAWLFVLIFPALVTASPRRSERADQRRLLGYGLLAVVLIACFLVPVLMYKLPIPRWVDEAIIALIAGGVFLLYRRTNGAHLR